MTDVAVTVPAGLDPAAVRRAAERAVAALVSIDHVREALADAPTSLGPGHLAQAALREERWRSVEEAGHLLTAAEVATLGGHPPERAREFTANLRRRKGVAGVRRRGSLGYPDFQFVDLGGRLEVAHAWQETRALMADAELSDADLLAWALAPDGWLDGRSPADEIRTHPEGVTEALRAAIHALRSDPW